MVYYFLNFCIFLIKYDCCRKLDYSKKKFKNHSSLGFPGGSVIKNLPADAGDTILIPDLGRSHIL